jgi:hypothetical protein
LMIDELRLLIESGDMRSINPGLRKTRGGPH